MKTNLSKSQVKELIDAFFQQSSFNVEQLKKIKRLAMKYNIKLGAYRKSFCKKCLSQLKGKITISKTHKTVVCSSCGYKNKFKLI